jgi:hypothetical protein
MFWPESQANGRILTPLVNLLVSSFMASHRTLVMVPSEQELVKTLWDKVNCYVRLWSALVSTWSVRRSPEGQALGPLPQ